MVFHCFLLLFLISLPFLHLYWLYLSYKCFCIVLPSSGYLLPFWSLVQVCLTLGVQKLLYSFFCFVSLSSISLSFSDFWITSSTSVLVPVTVDHGLSLSSPPSFLILFSIFSILLCSLSISMVSALFCRSTSKLLNFSLIFFVYSLHLSSIHLSLIIAFLAGSLQALQNHAISSAS